MPRLFAAAIIIISVLPREFRLTKRKEIERVTMRGQFFFTKLFNIKYLKNNLPASRFAVVAGLKVSKQSTKRNRIKRQTREALRKRLHEIKPGLDIVISARKEALQKTLNEIEQSLVYGLTNCHLIETRT